MVTLSTILRLALMLIVATGAEASQQPARPSSRPTGTTDGSGIIEGTVVLPSGNHVNGQVKIILSTLNDPGMGVYTDSNGKFIFSNLGAGTYYLEAIGDSSYESSSEQVRLARGARVTLTIYLREKNAGSNRKPGGVVSAHEASTNTPAAAKKEFEAATALANEGNLQEAIERYKKAIGIYPGYMMAHNDLGVQYLKLRRFAEAGSQFEAAIEIDPKAFNPRLNLGIVLIQQKKYDDALDQLRFASSIDSSSPAVHLYLGIVAVDTDDLPTAETELAKTLSIGGLEYSIAHFHIARVQMKKGEREEAIRELEAFLSTSPRGEEAAQARQLLDQLKQTSDE